MKKVLALILAVMMIVSLSAVVSAADASAKPKSYVAFQIFSGIQEPGDPKLSAVEWGSGINGEALLEALKKDTTIGAKFVECTNAESVAVVVGSFSDDSDEARAFALLCCQNKLIDKGIALPNGEEPVLDAGYYLVYDATEYDEDDTNTWINLSLLQVTQKGSFEIKQKVTVPEVDKEVYEESADWQKAADYDIGDSVPFRLTATVPDIRAYKCYQIVFHDHLTDGLSFEKESLQVTVYLEKNDGEALEIYRGNGLDRYILTVHDDRNFDVKINDLVTLGAVEGDKIIVTYTAVLNEGAIVGSAGNPNKVYLDYSNNPQDSCGGQMGSTPESEVIVYTWGDNVNKVTGAEGNIHPLAGAKFELFKKNADGSLKSLGEKEVLEVKDAEGKLVSYTAKFNGLDSGTYILRETVVPDGYNGIDDIEFNIVATFDGTDIKEFTVDNGFTAEEGIVSADILNKVGVVLPETGGAGTKALTAVGACALICGLVFGITKKRAGEED